MRDLVSAPHGAVCAGYGCDRRMATAQLVDADQVARGIAEGAVANPIRLLGRLLDDLSLGQVPT